MKFLLVFFIYSVPVFLAILGIALLIRSSIKTKPSYYQKKAKRITCKATVGERKNHYMSNPTGFYDIYSVDFIVDGSEVISLRMSKKEIKKLNAGDKVMLTYQGKKYIKAEKISSSSERDDIKSVPLRNWYQLD